MDAEKIAYCQKADRLLHTILHAANELCAMKFAPYPVDTKIRQEVERLIEGNIKEAGCIVLSQAPAAQGGGER